MSKHINNKNKERRLSPAIKETSLGELIELSPSIGRGNGKGRRSKNQKVRALAEYSKQQQKILGSNKAGVDYALRRKDSMSRYKSIERTNLFAIVLPAGHGKTYLSHRYGLIDVDYLISEKEHDYYLEKRLQIMNGYNTWTQHNNEWYARMNKTLDLLDYSKPIVLLVHHEETALELGAIVMGGAVLDEATFENNIKGRDHVSQHFSRMSRQSYFMARIDNSRRCSSNAEVEAHVLRLHNANQLPIACPYKYEVYYNNPHYHRDLPDWVVSGKTSGREVDISDLVGLYEAGKIPKQCVDYFVSLSSLKTAYDFGTTILDWVKVLAEIPPVSNEPVGFNLEGDMLEVFPARSPKEMSRANLTIRRLIETFDIWDYDEILWIGERQVGAPQVFVASLISHWVGLGVYTSVAEFLYKWYAVNHRSWTRIMKDLHTLIRTSRFVMNTEITEVDRQSLMYMDLLIGRAEYIIDEARVVEERQADSYESEHLSYDPDIDMFTRAQYNRDFEVAVAEAYMRVKAEPRKVRFKDFFDFYELRKTWLTKGSLVKNLIEPQEKRYYSHVLDVIHNTLTEIQNRHNKQSFFEMHELMDAIGGITLDEFNVTKCMIKYETGGKERVLLPGSLVHFLLFCYVLTVAEKQSQIGSVRLNTIPDDAIINFDRKMATGIHHFLYDWADFNEQHSADEMAAVIRELNKTVNAPRDYAMFVDAIAEGMYHMQLQDREGRRHKIWKGLYSGWRGTTWINSVLNFVYIDVALMSYERLYNTRPVLMIDHGGDDIDIMLSDGTDGEKLLKVMDSMLFNANKWKQMVGKRSEFFRNTISNRRVYASPTRALASFVAGDWEGSGNAKLVERLYSLLDQVAKMRRRGVSEEFCLGAVTCCVSHWTKIKEGVEWLSIPKQIIHGHKDDGGLGIPDGDGNVWRLRDQVPDIEEGWVKNVVPDAKASRDYVRRLSKDLEEYSFELIRQDELALRFAEDAFEFGPTVEKDKWTRLLDFKTVVTAVEPVVVPKSNDELFGIFMEYGSMKDDVYKYDKVGRLAELSGFVSKNGKRLSKAEIVATISEGEVSLEAIEFQGNAYYRRLVPEFLALEITTFCRELINRNIVDTGQAEDYFETLCSMCRRLYGHMM